MINFAKQTGILLISGMMILMLVQIINFHEYAYEATWIGFKRLIHIESSLDDKKLGAICNSVRRIECSAEIFKELLSEDPGDVVLLSNYAVSLTQLKKFNEAEPYYKAYFSGGGSAYDVMYWYAKALTETNRKVEALPWYYNSISLDFRNLEFVDGLVQALTQLNRKYEAQSLLLSLQTQADDVIFQEKVKQELSVLFLERTEPPRNLASTDTQNKLAEVQKIFFPAMDGRHFFIPVQSEDKAGYIKYGEEDRETQISGSDLKQYNLKFQKLAANRVLIHHLKIGPFQATQFEAIICENCESRLGGKLLAQFSARIDSRGKVPFLILQQGDE
jgi:tetratricopeptide (TPR) repeat protein